MSEKRLGRQTPTTSVVLPYRETFGDKAIELYNKTRRTAQPKMYLSAPSLSMISLNLL